jgi:hypothetical protein
MTVSLAGQQPWVNYAEKWSIDYTFELSFTTGTLD